MPVEFACTIAGEGVIVGVFGNGLTVTVAGADCGLVQVTPFSALLAVTV